MRNPISAVAKVAANPEQAKLFVSMLAAEGIPATTDGTPPDEFAMSQRLMNLAGCKVMVPTEALERAKEILKPAEVDLDELTRQALSAENSENPATGEGS